MKNKVMYLIVLTKVICTEKMLPDSHIYFMVKYCTFNLLFTDGQLSLSSGLRINYLK